ncbi:hypothetical protein [Haloferax sp. DFSO60]|uniref:hypothetical protein n=1 Tax=Haloferax sp. DFSO60 TaxID=3388652 RepID=UPI00397E77DE
MASSDDAPDLSLRSSSDLKVALVAAACTVGLTLALQYGVGADVPLIYRLSPLAPYFVFVFTRGAALSERAWQLLIFAVSLVTLGVFAL